MHEAIVEKLYNEYIANGFISEDKVFDTLQKEGVPLFDVEYICDQLLARGVIILEENDEENDENDDEQEDLSQTDYKAVYLEILELDEGLCDIVEYMRNVQPPQRREWQNLLPQAQNGNLYARNRVFDMYMRVAAKIALQYARRYDLPIADTIQDGFYGLSIAIDKFEYGRQDHFTTYFPFWVRQNIMREAQTRNPTVYIPVHVKDRLFTIYDIEDTHNCEQCARYRVCPNLISEIAIALESDEKEARYLYNLIQPFLSLEELIENEYEDDQYELNSDQGLFADSLIEQMDVDRKRAFLREKLNVLTMKEEYVLRLRYGLVSGTPMTLEEVGQDMNITRERVRQIESKAIRKLTKIAEISKKKHKRKGGVQR